MSDSDLRPPGSQRPPSKPAPGSGAARWWEPLASKRGIILLLIFVGLVFLFFDEISGRFSKQDPQSARVWPDESVRIYDRKIEIRKKVASLNVEETRQLLLQEIARLPGDDPPGNFEVTRDLALRYALKWQSEDTNLDSNRSSLTKNGLKQSRDAQWYESDRKMSSELAKANPDYRKVFADLSHGAENLNGHHLQHFANKIVESLEAKWKIVAQMPLYAKEIAQLFTQMKAAPSTQRFNIAYEIETRVQAYAAAEQLRRAFPSSQTDARAAEKRAAAEERLKRVAGAPFDTAVKLILESLPDASAAAIENAVRKIRDES